VVLAAMSRESLLGGLRAPGTPPIHQIGVVVASCDEAVGRYAYFDTTGELGFILEVVEMP
jgi:hypothetical protein